MIKINLLPYRAARSKENIRRQVSVFLLLVILVVLVMSVYTVHLKNRVDSLTTQVTQANAELVKYTAKAKEVDEINKKNDILQQKTNVMKDLKKSRKDPMIMLSSLSELVVPQRMWITEFSTNNDNVSIKGIGLDEITVADFLKRLEQSALYTNVNVVDIKAFQTGEIKAKQFNITCKKDNTPNKQAKRLTESKAIK